MLTTAEGKDLPLTRYGIETASQNERMLYGRFVAERVEESTKQQKELAEAAGVTPRTIRNLLQSKTAPQAEVLVKLLIALGYDLDGDGDPEIRTYTTMMAPAIRRIHPDYRAEAVSSALGQLLDAAVAHPAEPQPGRHLQLVPEPTTPEPPFLGALSEEEILGFAADARPRRADTPAAGED